MEPRWVMSSMATWAVWILTMIMWNRLNLCFLKIFAWILEYLAILFFVLFSILFLIRIYKFPGEIKKDLRHPITANFFAWIFISASIIVSWIWNVLEPLWWAWDWTLFAKIFYVIALVLGIVIPIIVPFMFTISESVDLKHAVWIWFLPPVWIFVLVFAWNFMSLHWIWSNFIVNLNILLIWIAFMLYILVSSMVYSRLKFHPLPAPEVAPSFVIGLAPVWVSIIAINTFYQVLEKSNIFNFDLNVLKTLINLLSGLLAWFWTWWFFITILILWYYLIKKSLPFTLWWWALVFPIAAFWIWLKFVALDLSCYYLCSIVTFIWWVTLILWFIVTYKTLKGIITKKIFIRPKVIKQ